jgi:hypothetical protein
MLIIAHCAQWRAHAYSRCVSQQLIVHYCWTVDRGWTAGVVQVEPYPEKQGSGAINQFSMAWALRLSTHPHPTSHLLNRLQLATKLLVVATMHTYKYFALLAVLYISGSSASSVLSARDVEKADCSIPGNACRTYNDCCGGTTCLSTKVSRMDSSSESDVIKSNPTKLFEPRRSAQAPPESWMWPFYPPQCPHSHL